METNNAEYLGDGIYVMFDGFQVVVWTDNGVYKSDLIFFHPDTAEELVSFFIKCFGDKTGVY